MTDVIPPPKIVVLGAGLIGAYIGGRLAIGGADVTLIGRPKAMAELKASGLNLTDYTGAELRLDSKAIKATSDPAALEDADLILLTVKNHDTLTAAGDIARHVLGQPVVLSFQNGVSNMPRLRDALSTFKVLAGIVPFNVTRPGHGHLHQGLAGKLFVEADDAIEPYLCTFEAAGLPLALHRDMASVAWAKLLMNLNNAINVVSGLSLKNELDQRGYRRSLALAQIETLRLLDRAGVKPATLGKLPPAWGPHFLSLPDFLYHRLAKTAGIQVDRYARSSMADDLAAGRHTEIDYLNGEVVALADLLCEPAPVNRKMIELVKAVEAGAKPKSAAELYGILSGLR